MDPPVGSKLLFLHVLYPDLYPDPRGDDSGGLCGGDFDRANTRPRSEESVPRDEHRVGVRDSVCFQVFQF